MGRHEETHRENGRIFKQLAGVVALGKEDRREIEREESVAEKSNHSTRFPDDDATMALIRRRVSAASSTPIKWVPAPSDIRSSLFLRYAFR